MNDNPHAAAPSGLESLAWPQVVAILAAATGLGLIYNIASPLGVRAPETNNSPVVTSAGTNAHPTVITTATSTNSTGVTVSPVTLPDRAALRWKEVKALLAAGQIVLLDARPKSAYDIEHIPGALSLPANSEPAQFIEFVTQHPPSSAIVVYCGGGTCDLSHELREKLTKEFGYTSVKEMPGGIVEWRVTEGKSAPPGAQ